MNKEAEKLKQDTTEIISELKAENEKLKEKIKRYKNV